jgi:hypothetical protein
LFVGSKFSEKRSFFLHWGKLRFSLSGWKREIVENFREVRIFFENFFLNTIWWCPTQN